MRVSGSYEPDRVDPVRAAPIYRRLVEALDPWVDVWLGETLSCVAELHLIADAIADASSAHPLWVSFTVPETRDPGDDIVLHSGETMADVAEAVAARIDEIDAVLCNCAPPEQIGPALSSLTSELDRRDLSVRTGGYANAFPVERASTYRANEVIFERRQELTADRYADEVDRWVAGGATIVGGCCDMYPEHIDALAARVR